MGGARLTRVSRTGPRRPGVANTSTRLFMEKVARQFRRETVARRAAGSA